MHCRSLQWLSSVMMIAVLVPARADDIPNLPEGKELQKGVRFHEVTLQRAGVPMKLWIYLPDPVPAEKLPCILIAPAGSRMFHGMTLEDGDRDEHLPYPAKGFAVLAYELDGALPEDATDAQLAAAIAAFRKSEAGVANAKAALDYAVAKVPQIDMARIYAVGHSSAATVALQVAQRDPRIVACVAFAPVCNVGQHLARAGAALDEIQPGTMNFFTQASPDRNIAKLKCPTLLFTAEDDTTVPSVSVVRFANALKKTNPQVKLVTVKSGGHHDSMINEGIPAAMEWLKALKAK